MIGSCCGKRLVVNQLGSHWNVRAGKTIPPQSRMRDLAPENHENSSTTEDTKVHEEPPFKFSRSFVPFVVDAFGRTAYFQDRHRENQQG